MNRRAFITGLGAVLVGPLGVEAQQAGKVPHIGFLGGSPLSQKEEAFRQGFRELGYTEGRNIIVEYRWAEGKLERLPELAAELVGRKVDVIVAEAPQAALAAYHATRTIPIVIIGVGDPVALGLAASLAHPGANVTGTASFGPELNGKILELLKELVPGIKRVGILWMPVQVNHVRGLKALEEGLARSLAIQILPLSIMSPGDFEAAFRTAVTEHAGAVWVFGDPMFSMHRDRLAALALDSRLPSMFFGRLHVEAGGLVSYAPNFAPLFRRAATYVDKILKGAKPADLPIEQPTILELVINLKTAKSLGLTIPPSLLLRADQVIE